MKKKKKKNHREKWIIVGRTSLKSQIEFHECEGDYAGMIC